MRRLAVGLSLGVLLGSACTSASPSGPPSVPPPAPRAEHVESAAVAPTSAAPTPADVGLEPSDSEPSAPRGCPEPEEVFFAEWNPALERGGSFLPTRGYWGLRLGHGGFEEGRVAPRALEERGIPRPPPEVWILRDGAPPCHGNVVGFVAEHVDHEVDEDADVSTHMVSAIVESCVPAESGRAESGRAKPSAWAVAGGSLAPDCQLVSATRRTGDSFTADNEGVRKGRKTRVPAPYSSLRPRGRCPSPCATEWAVAEVPTDPPLARVKISRIAIVPSTSVCDWDSFTRMGQFFIGDDGKPHPLSSSGLADNLGLAGALVEGGEPRLVLYSIHGRWAVHRLDPEHRLQPGVERAYRRGRTGDCGAWLCCCGC